MRGSIDSVLVLVLLSNLVLLGTSRLAVSIRWTALQGMLLAVLTLLVQADDLTYRAIFLALGSIAIKAVVFPWLLFRALREATVRREQEPYVSYTLSLFIGMLLLGGSVWLGGRLPIPGPHAGSLVVPVAFFSILSGLFLIICRRTALSQVIGYLVLENGIYTFGISLAHEEPLLVELGVLLDVFAAVFVMGIMIFHISREFDHIDADRLSTLKDARS